MKKIISWLGICAIAVLPLLIMAHSLAPLHIPGITGRPKTTVRPPIHAPLTGSAAQVIARKAGAPVQSGRTEVATASVRKTKSGQKMVTVDKKEYPLRTYKALSMPNDPQASQWWVSNAKLDQSWSLPSGSTQTTLAVIDTGFDLSHEEFANRWYTNPGESGSTTQENPSQLNCTDRGLPLSQSCNLIDDNGDGVVDDSGETGAATYENPSRRNCTDQGKSLDKSCNLIDDDGNGYVDDVSGWDFINWDNKPLAGELNPNGAGTTHGTETAGVAAATGNNGKGIAGVDWNTKILPIQALDDDSYGDTLSVGRSIYYAIQQGADIISISLGSTQPDDYVRQAVQEALRHGIVVVAAAGNDGCDCMVYPGNYPEVLTVGALDNNNSLASFSSYGQNLDILAPGTNLTLPTYSSSNTTSAYASGLNGTSFSTPMVAGMLTRLKSLQPTATPTQLIAALTENANRLGLASTVQHDTHYGFGTLDTYAAANRMSTPKTGSLAYQFTPVSLGSIFDKNTPAEPAGNALIYTCDSGTPSTAIYDDTMGDLQFFTVSKSENQDAVALGYTSSLLTYACVTEPQDTASVSKNINMFEQYKNRYVQLSQ